MALDPEFSDVAPLIEGDKCAWLCIESIAMLKGDRFEPPFIVDEPVNGVIPEFPLDKPLGIPLLLFDKPVGNIDADIPLLAKGPVVMDDNPPLPAKLLSAAFPEVISPGPYIIDLSDKALNAKKVLKNQMK